MKKNIYLIKKNLSSVQIIYFYNKRLIFNLQNTNDSYEIFKNDFDKLTSQKYLSLLKI